MKGGDEVGCGCRSGGRSMVGLGEVVMSIYDQAISLLKSKVDWLVVDKINPLRQRVDLSSRLVRSPMWFSGLETYSGEKNLSARHDPVADVDLQREAIID